VTELERALVRLGDELAFPEAPDVSERVLGRLAAAPAPLRRRVSRRALVLAFAVLALALGAAMAVPQARTAILEFFRLRGATVERVESLPRVPRPAEQILDLGRPVLVGPSRKRFIGSLLDLPEDERVEGTAGAVAWLVARGAHIVRVHDVREMIRVVRVVDAIARAGR